MTHLLPRALLLLILALPAPAVAGGMALAGHGVRAMGRAGAVVAGGDDPGAIWYNPAAIAGLPGLQVTLDGVIVLYSTEYTRVDSGGNLLAPVSDSGPILPLPVLALSRRVYRELYLGFSVTAPYSPVGAYPAPNYGRCDPVAPAHCIDTVHTDSPQRYSLITQDGTKFILLELVAAYRLLPQLSVGLSLQNYFINFVSLSSITSYNGALSSGPEDPDFDSLTYLKQLTLFNPSVKVGATYRPHPRVTLGLSYQLPFWVRGDAQVNVQLPLSPLYEKATVEGSTAEVKYTLPMCLRAGVEVRPVDELRLELGFDWEQWSAMRAIEVFPKDIYILNIPSIDRYKVPALATLLNFRDTFTVRLGGEYTFARFPLALRAGYIFESGAAAGAQMSVMAIDNHKHLLTLGLGYTVGGYRLDAMFARSFSGTAVVDFRESSALQVNPINPKGAVGVGGGSYKAAYSLIGLGVSKSFPW